MTTNAEPNQVPAEVFNTVKIISLRAALAALEEDDAARNIRVGSEIAAIIAAGPFVVSAVLGYLIQNFINGLLGGYGSPEAAAEEITRELARATLNPDQIGRQE
jgi:hypothetical protein